MDNASSEHIGKGVFIYIDDIIIYASDFDQFLSFLTSVFTRESMRLEDFDSSSSTCYQYDSLRVVEEGVERRQIFDNCQ